MTLSGDLTLQTVGKLAATPLYDQHPVRVIDLAGVGRVDSAAVALFLHWLRQTAHKPCRFTLINVPAKLYSLAALYDVADMLPMEMTSISNPASANHA